MKKIKILTILLLCSCVFYISTPKIGFSLSDIIEISD